jgi:hypothetical protein
MQNFIPGWTGEPHAAQKFVTSSTSLKRRIDYLRLRTVLQARREGPRNTAGAWRGMLLT